MCDCARQCDCRLGENLFLPAPAESNRSNKKERLPHPFRYTTKRKDGSYARKAKDEPTQHLSSPAFLDESAPICIAPPELIVASPSAGRRGRVTASCSSPTSPTNFIDPVNAF